MPDFFDNKSKSILPQIPACKNCGTFYSDFEGTGLLGCPECYEAFHEKLETLLRRVQGSSKHIGSRPVNLRNKNSPENTEQLRQQLKAAIAAQDFEKAAQIRDLIQDFEQEIVTNHGGEHE